MIKTSCVVHVGLKLKQLVNLLIFSFLIKIGSNSLLTASEMLKSAAALCFTPSHIVYCWDVGCYSDETSSLKMSQAD